MDLIGHPFQSMEAEHRKRYEAAQQAPEPTFDCKPRIIKEVYDMGKRSVPKNVVLEVSEGPWCVDERVIRLSILSVKKQYDPWSSYHFLMYAHLVDQGGTFDFASNEQIVNALEWEGIRMGSMVRDDDDPLPNNPHYGLEILVGKEGDFFVRNLLERSLGNQFYLRFDANTGWRGYAQNAMLVLYYPSCKEEKNGLDLVSFLKSGENQ